MFIFNKNKLPNRLIAVGAVFFCCTPMAFAEPAFLPQSPIKINGFSDLTKHWLEQNPDATSQYLGENDIHGIAENILLYQRNNGGWPENKHLLRKISHQEKMRVMRNKSKQDSSLDNHNTYPQIRYLMHAYQRTRHSGYLQAALQGFNYLLIHQYENGGWAHSPPAAKGYRQHVTIADEVMPGVLNLLRDAANRAPPFNKLPGEYAEKSKVAWKKGEQLLLDLQIRINDEPTIWAGQYDRSTLAPVAARSFELPGLVSRESVSVVEYLMAEPKPSKQVKIAIIAAVKWFDKHKIEDLVLEKVPAKTLQFQYHNSSYDWQVKKQAGAQPIWARFYDLNTQRPFMANRDGSKVYRFEALDRERRTGYEWYGSWPKQLLQTDYRKWKSKHLKKADD